jgi:DNA-binding winged helix-turn-helix (wHTH) protein/TolB-like protein/Flp pilus assembly protein TadD
MNRREPASKLVFEGYVLDPTSRVLTDPSGAEISLTSRVFDTLLHLVQNPGRVVSKEELIDAVWGNFFVEENNLSQNISQLRKLFGERPGERRFIETVVGKGFRFLPDVNTVAAEIDVSAPVIGNGTSDSAAAPISAGRSFNNLPLFVLGIALMLAIAIAYYYFSTSSPSTGSEPKKVAVLPFQSLVPESGNPALELGMTDTLIWKLSGGDLDVKPFSSVRRYSGTAIEPAEVGRELGVDAVLDGSINVADGRIRMSVRLTRSSDGTLMWADQFDENLGDVFTVQDSISARVASELKARLGVDRRKNYTGNVEAYQLYLQGRYLSQRARPDDINKSIGFFQKALAIDPNYAPAYAGIADAYRASVLLAEASPSEALPKAKNAAARSVEIDDLYAEGHAVRGWLAFWFDWDWTAAEADAKRSIELDPISSDSHQFYAHLLSNTGRHEESLAEIRKALEIEPVSLRANSLYGMFLYHARRDEEAVAQFHRVLELDPEYRVALMFGARALAGQGDYEGALAMVRRVNGRQGPATDPRAVEAVILAASGRRQEAGNILRELEAESKVRYISPYNMALIRLRLGDPDGAMELLERAYTARDIRLVFLHVERTWDPLRKNPGFQALLAKLNLPAS